jgi:REP element-mobilizing transposase RayT
MSREITAIEHGKFYHIYNRGINSQNIFFEDVNYLYFLQQYGKYIEKVAETFAWCLMPNHFHFLVKIKDEDEIEFMANKKPLLGLKTTKRVIKNTHEDPSKNLDKKKYKPSNQFSHLFNSYTQSVNKKYNRHGSLFEAPFRRILIDDEKIL